LAADMTTCGLSTGYPPFQYEEKGVAKGIDAQILKLYNSRFDRKIGVTQRSWDSLVSSFYFRGEPACLMGMEITQKRLGRFIFSDILYYRESVLFVLNSSKIKNFIDLKDRVISGDKDSKLDIYLRKHEEFDIRLKYFKTKEEAFSALLLGKIDGVIAPLRVGKFLLNGKKDYTIVSAGEAMRTPVAVAFKKGDKNFEEFNKNLKSLIVDERFLKIVNP